MPKQTGADFIDATNMETNPNKYRDDEVYFCTTKTTYKVKQKMFSFLLETLAKLGLPLYLLNSDMKDYNWGILRKLSHNRWSSISE